MRNKVLLLALLSTLLLAGAALHAASPKPRAVLLDHDGAHDDLLSLIMLLAMPHVDVKGVVVTPADCYLQPATAATLKILRLFARLDVEVSQGTLLGVHPFPRAWRKSAYSVDALPILNDFEGELPPPVPEPGHEFLARKIRESERQVTILITGPVTNLAAALQADPGISSKIEEVVWMGGALQVPGNVQDYEHDGSAEWNVYWDPPAAHRLWQTDVPITLVPLDATNKVPVSMAFLKRLARQREYPLSDLAGQTWAMTVGTIASYEYLYFMWDTLTTGYLGAPQFITFQNVRTRVVPSGKSAGKIAIDQKGRPVRAAFDVDVDGFQGYLLDLFKR